jgi:hypothetical protein
MKVGIRYDGSTYADAAIDDLIRPEPTRGSRVHIASVANFSDRKPTNRGVGMKVDENMEDPVSRKRLRRRVLERWENEGGRLCDEETK